MAPGAGPSTSGLQSVLVQTAGADGTVLTPDIQRIASKRLAICALAYAICYSLASFPPTIIGVLRGYGISLVALAASFVSVGIGVLVFLVARSEKLSSSRLGVWAIAFEVVGALGIHASVWGWEGWGFEIGYTPGASVPWVGVWVVIFPLVVPLRPRQAVVGSFLAASMVPLVLVASRLVHGPVDLWADVLFANVWPTYVCATVASIASRGLYRLTLALSKARRITSYHLVEKIGAGGMGEVWKAEHRMLARPAAIKLIRAEMLDGYGRDLSAVFRRFEREAKITAALSSPHTVELYDYGLTHDQQLYYVMEYLDGLDLQTLVAQHGAVDSARTVYLLRQICDSLAEAHARDLVHRDIKPANVFCCRVGLAYDFVKVLDFGLVADRRSWESEDTQLTVEGAVGGTPSFLAPEQARGEPVRPRTDVYAVGCVGYWLLTGELVFPSPITAVVVAKHLEATPEAPSERLGQPIAEDVEQLILRCLEKDPERRPTSAELARELDACSVAGQWTSEKAQSWWEHQVQE